MRDVLRAIDDCRAAFARHRRNRGGARWNQDWFPRLDAAAAYAIVRRHTPRRIVEIGSGHSTRFMARAVADGGLATGSSASIPRRAPPSRARRCTHVHSGAGRGRPGLFEGLAAGDILFIDSSHIAMPGTDVDRLFLDVLPRLPSGVLLHVHDILLPDAYPPEWEWRGYNEQIVVGALLQGGGWDLVFASRYAATRLGEAVAESGG